MNPRYSKVVYTKAIDKVIIVCKTHGEYSQQPSDHFKGRGCSACGFNRFSTADFIKKSKEAHGGKYDYLKSEFVKSIIKTTVTCKAHGDFQVSPNNHQNGLGCPVCSKLSKVGENSKKAKQVADKFLAKAIAVHGDKIVFSKVCYKTAKEKTVFICPDHGEWKARPDNILHGKGCPGCRREKILETNKERSLSAANEFAMRASEVHENKYEYSESKYVSVHEKLEIICPEHGNFGKVLPTTYPVKMGALTVAFLVTGPQNLAGYIYKL